MSFLANVFGDRRLSEGEIGRAARRALAWYKAEFCASFSKETVAWLFDRGDRKLVMQASDPARELRFVDQDQDETPSAISGAELLGSSVASALAARGVPRDAAKIFLLIPNEWFFVRRFDVPAAAEANLPHLLQADIERKTPFRAGDVVYTHLLSRRADAPGKMGVRLWILRRDIATRVLEGSGLGWDDLDAIAPEGPDEFGETPVITLARRGEAPDWFRRTALGLAGAAAALFLLSVGVLTYRQDAAEKELDAKIADVSQRANHVRKIADDAIAQSKLLNTLHEERSAGPAFADIWEEVSRVLPDGAYLTEMRLSEGKPGERAIDLVGFAESAAGLPALFDKSPMFYDAQLIGAITPNPQEKRETFSLRAKVRQKKAG